MEKMVLSYGFLASGKTIKRDSESMPLSSATLLTVMPYWEAMASRSRENPTASAVEGRTFAKRSLSALGMVSRIVKRLSLVSIIRETFSKTFLYSAALAERTFREDFCGMVKVK